MELKWYPPEIAAASYRIISKKSYSSAVFFGEPGKPGRPWMWDATAKIDFELELTKNFKRLGAIAPSFSELCESTFGLIRDQLKEEVYEWPRVTVRRSGEIAGSPRNIIDTGELFRGHTLERIL